jgi:hypothetical protein
MWKLEDKIRMHFEKNGAFVYVPTTHKMYEMNKTGSFILKLLYKLKCCETHELVAATQKKFREGKVKVENDIKSFLKQLKRNRIIREVK